MPTKHAQTIVKIKDGYRVVIYYRNSCHSTGFTLDTNKKNLKEQFNLKTRTLTKAWGDNYQVVNDKIYDKKNLIDNLIREANLKGVEDHNGYIRAFMDKKSIELKTDIELATAKVSDLFSKYIEFKREKFKHRKKQTGINKYVDFHKKIMEFESECKGSKKNINQIDLSWRNRLCEFMTKKRIKKTEIQARGLTYTTKKIRGISNSTLNGYMFIFLNFLGWVEYNFKIEVDREVKNFTPYQTPTQEENIITPTLKQWEDFKNYVATSKPQQKALDLFFFSCYTGMRYSDCVTLSYLDEKKDNTDESIIKIRKKSEDDNETTIKKKAIKTDGFFEVTLNPIAYGIYQKYNKDFRDKFASNQQTNKMLRSIWKRLPSWHQKVTVKEYVLNEEREIEMPMYEASSFHTARKIFSTFLIATGNFSLGEIMRMTGWKDDRMFRTYVNFFNDSNRKKKEIMF